MRQDSDGYIPQENATAVWRLDTSPETLDDRLLKLMLGMVFGDEQDDIQGNGLTAF